MPLSRRFRHFPTVEPQSVEKVDPPPGGRPQQTPRLLTAGSRGSLPDTRFTLTNRHLTRLEDLGRARDLYASESHRRRCAERQRLRGVPADGNALGPSAAMYRVRSHRLLRQLPRPPRDRALPFRGAPDHPVVRARRGLVLLLRRRHRVRAGRRRPEPVAHVSRGFAATSRSAPGAASWPPGRPGPARREVGADDRARPRPRA